MASITTCLSSFRGFIRNSNRRYSSFDKLLPPGSNQKFYQKHQMTKKYIRERIRMKDKVPEEMSFTNRERPPIATRHTYLDEPIFQDEIPTKELASYSKQKIMTIGTKGTKKKFHRHALSDTFIKTFEGKDYQPPKDQPAKQIRVLRNMNEDESHFQNPLEPEKIKYRSNVVARKFNSKLMDNPIYSYNSNTKTLPLKVDESTKHGDDEGQHTFQLETNHYSMSKIKEVDHPDGKIILNLAADEFNLDDYLKKFQEATLKPLDKCTEDLSDLHPNVSPTFNFASVADESPAIQELAKMGVELYRLEKNDKFMRAVLSLNLEDIKPYIQFLHDCGVPDELLGRVITKNPLIFKEDLDDLQTRIRYLKAHKFTKKQVAKIVMDNPTWLTWATKKIDERLGYFQAKFKLSGDDVRYVTSAMPRIVTHNMKSLEETTFGIVEEMGFSDLETKILLLSLPRLWVCYTRKGIVDSFDYLHNMMKISHLRILKEPHILTCRQKRIKIRNDFLITLGKAQYDPAKPNYVSLTSLIAGSDIEFCRDIAKVSVDTFNLYLKNES